MWFSWFRVLTARLFYFSLVEGWVKLGNNRTRVMFKGTETALLFENCSCYIMVTKPRPPPTCPFHRKTRQQSSTSISHLKKKPTKKRSVFPCEFDHSICHFSSRFANIVSFSFDILLLFFGFSFYLHFYNNSINAFCPSIFSSARRHLHKQQRFPSVSPAVPVTC